MHALRCAPILLTLLLGCGCSKKLEVRDDPATKPSVAAPASTVATATSTTDGGSDLESLPYDVGTLFAGTDSGLGFGHGSGTGKGQGLGCPCGCDHSQDMVAELRGRDRDEALRAIDDSLRTIGEREDAGYITDRMVRHRLRLVAYGSELGRPGPARFTSVPAIREGISGAIGQTKVRAALHFHGETTELVKGKEKLLQAAFVLRLELENAGATDVTLREPTLAGDTPLPVSRWYVAGGDGQPWDGVLHPATKVLVHVIGYAGEPVPPGTWVHTTVQLESLSLKIQARARHSWNEVD